MTDIYIYIYFLLSSYLKAWNAPKYKERTQTKIRNETTEKRTHEIIYIIYQYRNKGYNINIYNIIIAK